MSTGPENAWKDETIGFETLGEKSVEDIEGLVVETLAGEIADLGDPMAEIYFAHPRRISYTGYL